jgi:hypothetical protein
MSDLHVWFVDAKGYFSGELDAENANDDLETLRANAAKHGHRVIEKGDDLEATRPPMSPPTPEQQARVEKQARLGELRQKGYLKLSPAERREAQALRFDLFGDVGDDGTGA